jgi:hypothetical protein
VARARGMATETTGNGQVIAAENQMALSGIHPGTGTDKNRPSRYLCNRGQEQHDNNQDGTPNEPAAMHWGFIPGGTIQYSSTRTGKSRLQESTNYE